MEYIISQLDERTLASLFFTLSPLLGLPLILALSLLLYLFAHKVNIYLVLY